MTTVIQEVIAAKLAANGAVAALVADRIYPKRLPQGATFPAITYFRVGQPFTVAMGNTPVMSEPRIQVSCWAKTNLGSLILALRVRQALAGTSDATTIPPFANIVVEDEGPDLYEADTALHHVPVDFIVTLMES